jgi:hypothetical protein
MGTREAVDYTAGYKVYMAKPGRSINDRGTALHRWAPVNFRTTRFGLDVRPDQSDLAIHKQVACRCCVLCNRLLYEASIQLTILVANGYYLIAVAMRSVTFVFPGCVTMFTRLNAQYTRNMSVTSTSADLPSCVRTGERPRGD